MANAVATLRRSHDHERHATFTVDIQPGELVVLPGGEIGINNSLNLIPANSAGRYSTEGVVELQVDNATDTAALSEGDEIKMAVDAGIVTDAVDASGTAVGALRSDLPDTAGPHFVRIAINAAR